MTLTEFLEARISEDDASAAQSPHQLQADPWSWSKSRTTSHLRTTK